MRARAIGLLERPEVIALVVTHGTFPVEETALVPLRSPGQAGSSATLLRTGGYLIHPRRRWHRRSVR